MRARTRYIVPLALAALMTAACGESGSSGTGGDEDSTQASGDACAPIAGGPTTSRRPEAAPRIA